MNHSSNVAHGLDLARMGIGQRLGQLVAHASQGDARVRRALHAGQQ
ncbi:hypothetical protein [Microcystis phage MACPNOA1]|nr:hypothetical protein [Microcystis phage MACPNOA1]